MVVALASEGLHPGRQTARVRASRRRSRPLRWRLRPGARRIRTAGANSMKRLKRLSGNPIGNGVTDTPRRDDTCDCREKLLPGYQLHTATRSLEAATPCSDCLAER